MVAQVDIVTATDRDFYQTFEFMLPDGVTPIDLSNATYKMSLRRTAQDPGVMFTITSKENDAGQVIPINAAQGQFAVWIKQSQLVKLPIGVYVHSLLAITPVIGAQPALAQPIWDGMLTLNPGPSR